MSDLARWRRSLELGFGGGVSPASTSILYTITQHAFSYMYIITDIVTQQCC